MYGDYFDDFVNQYLNFIDINDNMCFSVHRDVIKVKEVIHTGIESYGFVINSKLGITGDSSLCDNVRRSRSFGL